MCKAGFGKVADPYILIFFLKFLDYHNVYNEYDHIYPYFPTPNLISTQYPPQISLCHTFITH